MPKVTEPNTLMNVKVLSEAPAMAMSSLYQTSAHSLGLMFENAVNSQNNSNVLALTAVSQAVTEIYSLDTIADAISVATMLNAQEKKPAKK